MLFLNTGSTENTTMNTLREAVDKVENSDKRESFYCYLHRVLRQRMTTNLMEYIIKTEVNRDGFVVHVHSDNMGMTMRLLLTYNPKDGHLYFEDLKDTHVNTLVKYINDTLDGVEFSHEMEHLSGGNNVNRF